MGLGSSKATRRAHKPSQWESLPWDLWVQISHWLDMCDCLSMAGLSRWIYFKHGQDRLHPVVLDLRRAELVRDGPLPRGLVARLNLASSQWHALQELDLGTTDPGELAGLGHVPLVRCRSKTHVSRGLSRQVEIKDDGGHGSLLVDCVQVGQEFAATWIVPDFIGLRHAILAGSAQEKRILSPRFRALGHDWRGMLFPVGNTRYVDEGCVSGYIQHATKHRHRCLRRIKCKFAFSVLGIAPGSDIVRVADNWKFDAMLQPDDRGWHSLFRPGTNWDDYLHPGGPGDTGVALHVRLSVIG